MQIRPPTRSASLRLVLVAAAFALLALPSSAFAGRLWATGHDADYHCDGNVGSLTSQCHYLQIAVGYVRGAAPDPSKKVLALDKGAMELDSSLTAMGVPHDTVDPTSPGFASMPLSTDTYSAILVASDSSCGGCDLNQTATEDSDAINARKDAIAAFFNAGGGVLALSGADHGGAGSSSDPNVYYNFLPLPVGGQPVQKPFCLTNDGLALGLEDQACPDTSKRTGTHRDLDQATHNSFNLPTPGSAIQVAETDSTGLAETLFAEGTISGGQLKRSTATTVSCAPASVAAGSTTTCTANVSDVQGGSKSNPTGPVSFTSNGAGSFGGGGSCTLVAGATVGQASCSISYTPAASSAAAKQVTAAQATAGRHITATYGGDTAHTPSSGSTDIGVLAASKKCVDLRRFTYKVHHGPRSRVVKVVVTIDGKRAKTVKGRNVQKVTISKLPQVFHSVKIVVTLSNGSTRTSKRVYFECTKGKPKITSHHAKKRRHG